MVRKANLRTRRDDSSDSEDESNAQKKEESTAAAKSSSTSDKSQDVAKTKEQIEELKQLQKLRQRTRGVDAFSLALGEPTSKTVAPEPASDPWKLKAGGLVDLRRIKEKRGNEIVRSMHSQFARETNQRDEDAEMQKFIEEQLRLRKETNSGAAASTSAAADEDEAFKKPLDLNMYLLKTTTISLSASKVTQQQQDQPKPSEETLSEQMLSGIPEVDLGVEERMRNIEETERFKQRFIDTKQQQAQRQLEEREQYLPSAQFVQHKRFDDSLINPEHMIRPLRPKAGASGHQEQQPVVGDMPKHELLQSEHGHGKKSKMASELDVGIRLKKIKPSSEEILKKPVAVDKPSDEYCVERFKKNMRQNKTAKIRIA